MNGFLVLRRAVFAGLKASVMPGLMPALMIVCLAQVALAADRCAAPEDLTAGIVPLPHVASVLKPGSTLNVLTVGSATVFSPNESLKPGSVTGLALGMGGSRTDGTPMPSDAAFPMQMARMLRASNPGVDVKVTVKGGRGMTADQMLDILKQELPGHHYQLVIWQTGTVEAVHTVPAATFYQTLSDGAALVAAAGADLVLVDPQFSRFLHANADLDPYAQTMQQIAAQPGVILFHRFDLMRFWANEGQIDLERTPKSLRLKTVEDLHACLGGSLAHMVAAAAHLPPT
jgi:hypothetical protein